MARLGHTTFPPPSPSPAQDRHGSLVLALGILHLRHKHPTTRQLLQTQLLTRHLQSPPTPPWRCMEGIRFTPTFLWSLTRAPRFLLATVSLDLFVVSFFHMPRFVKAFGDGEEPELDLSAFSARSLTDLALQVVSAIREALPEDTPRFSSMVFSLLTFLGISRGGSTHVAHAPVIIRVAQDPKPIAKVFIRQVATDSDAPFSTTDLTGVRGWSTSRKIAQDDGDDDTGEALGIVEAFLAPQALKSFVDASADVSGSLVFQGILADQLSQATMRLLEHETTKVSYTKQLLRSVLLEVDGDLERGWTTPLLRWSLRSEWHLAARDDLRAYSRELRAAEHAEPAEDASAPSWGMIDVDDLEGEQSAHPLVLSTSASVPPSAARFASSTMDPSIVSIFKGLLEVVKSQASPTAGDLEGQRMVRVFKEALSPELARLLTELESRASGTSTHLGQMKSAHAALRSLDNPSRVAGDSAHASLGASIASPGECVAYVSAIVGERTCHVGLSGALLGTSTTDGHLAADFLSGIGEKGLQRLGLEVENSLRDQGEPSTALSTTGAMGSRRVDVLRGLLSFDGVAGYLPLFLPPRFRLGETDYADSVETEGGRSGSASLGWSSSRIEFKSSHRNLAADRPRASRFFVDIKSSHRCAALLLSLHGYLSSLEAAGVPRFFLRFLRGGLTRALAHADETVNNWLGLPDQGTVRPRTIHYLTHAFIVIDEAFASFVAQFARPITAAAPFDNYLRDRDDAEATPLFKRHVHASGGSTLALPAPVAKGGKG